MLCDGIEAAQMVYWAGNDGDMVLMGNWLTFGRA